MKKVYRLTWLLLILLIGTSGCGHFQKAMYRADLSRTGVYQTTGVPNLTAIKWRAKLGFGAGVSSPVMADGLVLGGNIEGDVYAFDAETGNTKWRFQYRKLYSQFLCGFRGDRLFWQ